MFKLNSKDNNSTAENRIKCCKKYVHLVYIGYFVFVLNFAGFNLNNSIAYSYSTSIVEEGMMQIEKEDWQDSGENNVLNQAISQSSVSKSNLRHIVTNNQDGIPSMINALSISDTLSDPFGNTNSLPSSSSTSSSWSLPSDKGEISSFITSPVLDICRVISSKQAFGDFNGDGYADLAIGVPGEDLIGKSDAGAVQVIYGSVNGLSTNPKPDQLWTQDSVGVDGTAEPADNFGSSLSSGDYNNDGKDDLAIGVSGEDIGASSVDAGAVNVIYGSSSGLSSSMVLADQSWTQNSANVQDVAESSDLFSFSLSSGDYNNDGNDDLAIGAPGEAIGVAGSAGAVHVIYGSQSLGLSATAVLADQFWTQDSPNIEDDVEDFDSFGTSLSSSDFNGDGPDDLAIGAATEGVGGGLGAVHVVYGSSPSGLSAISALGDQFWTQDSPNVEDVAEFLDCFGTSLSSGDYNGDGFYDLAIGVPGETTGIVSEGGAVNVIYGSSQNGISPIYVLGDQFWTQDSPNVLDNTESSDRFGTALSSGDYNGDGQDDLLIGVPFEDIEGFIVQIEAGGTNVIHGSGSVTGGLSATLEQPSIFITQPMSLPESDDRFGSSLSSGDYNNDGRDDITIGAPGEDIEFDNSIRVDVGAVNVMYGSSFSTLTVTGNQYWIQKTPNELVSDNAENTDSMG